MSQHFFICLTFLSLSVVVDWFTKGRSSCWKDFPRIGCAIKIIIFDLLVFSSTCFPLSVKNTEKNGDLLFPLKPLMFEKSLKIQFYFLLVKWFSFTLAFAFCIRTRYWQWSTFFHSFFCLYHLGCQAYLSHTIFVRFSIIIFSQKW